MVMAPNGHTLYLCSVYWPKQGATELFVRVDTTTNAASAPIRLPAPMYGYGLSMSADGKTLYLINYAYAIQPVDLATGAFLRPVHIGNFTAVATGPGGTGYAAGYAAPETHPITGSTPAQAYPVSLATGRTGKALPLGPAEPDQVVLAP